MLVDGVQTRHALGDFLRAVVFGKYFQGQQSKAALPTQEFVDVRGAEWKLSVFLPFKMLLLSGVVEKDRPLLFPLLLPRALVCSVCIFAETALSSGWPNGCS